MSKKIYETTLYILVLIIMLFNLIIYTNLRVDNIIINSINKSCNILPNNIVTYKSLYIIYNLPELLWVFCASILAWQLKYKNINLYFIPVIFTILLEFFQYFQFTDGTFDIIDLLSAILGFIISFLFLYKLNKNYIRFSYIFFIFINISLILSDEI